MGRKRASQSLSAEQRDAILERRALGDTYDQIADRLRVSRSAAHRVCSAAGESMKRPDGPASDADEAAIRGYAATAVAARLAARDLLRRIRAGEEKRGAAEVRALVEAASTADKTRLLLEGRATSRTATEQEPAMSAEEKAMMATIARALDASGGN